MAVLSPSLLLTHTFACWDSILQANLSWGRASWIFCIYRTTYAWDQFSCQALEGNGWKFWWGEHISCQDGRMASWLWQPIQGLGRTPHKIKRKDKGKQRLFWPFVAVCQMCCCCRVLCIGRCHGEPPWVVLWKNPRSSDGILQTLDNRGL